MRISFHSALVIAVLLGAGADSWSQGRKAEDAYHGGIVSPPIPKPKFTLTDTSGNRFDFRAQTDGYITLLFFGYASCPDICPMHMAYLGSALKKLPKDVSARFRVVFVTTDPERDKPPALRAWLKQFGNDIVGLTGTAAEIKTAETAAGVPLSKGAPTYDHAAFVLAYTRDNLAHIIYPYGVGEADWLNDLPRLANENWR